VPRARAIPGLQDEREGEAGRDKGAENGAAEAVGSYSRRPEPAGSEEDLKLIVKRSELLFKLVEKAGEPLEERVLHFYGHLATDERALNHGFRVEAVGNQVIVRPEVRTLQRHCELAEVKH